jgi:folate-dependent phosphoribosylglycinamide formyltransferase PurN
MSELHNPSVAILASGSGSTAEAFIHATQDGRVAADVGLIICNNPPEKAGIFTRIERLNRELGLDIEATEIGDRTHRRSGLWRGQTLEESAAIF